MKKVGISQSNYIPWKGYFDLINSVDVFILLDSVQYTKSDWRNRNRIKTPNGSQWLSIPVLTRGKSNQTIKETFVQDDIWRENHWKTIQRFYSKSKYFKTYSPTFEKLYSGSEYNLSEINRKFILAICDCLDIKTEIRQDNDFDLIPGKNERIISLCQQLDADVYLSGPRGSSYLDGTKFRKAGIEVSYFSYEGYREYEQRFPPFVHEVSVLDLLFNTGDQARSFMLT